MNKNENSYIVWIIWSPDLTPSLIFLTTRQFSSFFNIFSQRVETARRSLAVNHVNLFKIKIDVLASLDMSYKKMADV